MCTCRLPRDTQLSAPSLQWPGCHCSREGPRRSGPRAVLSLCGGDSDWAAGVSLLPPRGSPSSLSPPGLLARPPVFCQAGQPSGVAQTSLLAKVAVTCCFGRRPHTQRCWVVGRESGCGQAGGTGGGPAVSACVARVPFGRGYPGRPLPVEHGAHSVVSRLDPEDRTRDGGPGHSAPGALPQARGPGSPGEG